MARLVAEAAASGSGCGSTAHAEDCEQTRRRDPRGPRQKGEKLKHQGKLTLARLRSSDGNPKLQAKEGCGEVSTRRLALWFWSTRPLCLGALHIPLQRSTTSPKTKGCFFSDKRGCQCLRANSISCTIVCSARHWQSVLVIFRVEHVTNNVHLMEWQVEKIGLKPRCRRRFGRHHGGGQHVEPSLIDCARVGGNMSWHCTMGEWRPHDEEQHTHTDRQHTPNSQQIAQHTRTHTQITKAHPWALCGAISA